MLIILHNDTIVYYVMLSSAWIVALMGAPGGAGGTADLRTKILDFSGFGTNIISVVGSGILRPIGNFPKQFEPTS